MAEYEAGTYGDRIADDYDEIYAGRSDADAAADFLAVRAALRGDRELAPDEGLTPDRYPEPLA